VSFAHWACARFTHQPQRNRTFILFGRKVADQLGLPARIDQVVNAGTLMVVLTRSLAELSESGEAKARLWKLLCEVSARD
jgi:hypothetical protein